jgi:two-component system cell cycle sensor histidine kinase/response regulator CckA
MRSEELFAQTPTILFDNKGKVIELNAAAETALNTSSAQITGLTLRQVGFTVTDQAGRTLPIARQPWILAARNRATIHNAITATISPEGKCAWQQSTSMPLQKTEKDKPHGVLTVFTDISGLMELQTRSVQSQKMEAVASLASGITHDFNNILTVIRSAVQLLLMDTDPADPRTEALKDIENETIRGAELTGQMLLFTKPPNGSKEKTRINQHILQLRRLIRRTLPRSIHLHHNLCSQELLCQLNQTNFEQIFLNLIINARDAMPNGGDVTITTSWVETEHDEIATGAKKKFAAKIQVRDTGDGIAADVASHIFEPFFSTKKHSGGTGLGLAIVHNLVRKVGGNVSVATAPGKGSTFSITLPARKARMLKQPAAADSHTRSMAGYETILVVDDETLITKSTARFLERYGYNAITAFNGDEAMDQFRLNKDNISVVLLDMEMPHLSGRQCLEQMKSLKPGMKIIMLSGHILKPGDWNPTDQGADLFVQKPFDSASLLLNIRSLIDS